MWRALVLLAVLLALPPADAAGRPFTQEGLSTPARPEHVRTPPLRPFVPPTPDRFELERGGHLLVIAREGLPLVDGTLLFPGGRLAEDPELAGVADLMADVLREGGSERTSGTQLDDWLDSHAASIRITSDLDALRIDFSCVSTDLGNVLVYIGELLVLPAYPESEIEKSRARLATRLARSAEDPAQLAEELLDELCAGEDSLIARRPTLASVEAITRRDLLGLHRRVIGPARLLAGVTGAVEPNSLLAQMNTLLARLEPAGPLPRHDPAVFRRPSRTTIYLYDRPNAAQSEVRIASPGTRRLDRDYVPLVLWSHAVGQGGAANRMMVRLRAELGLIYGGSLAFRPGWARAGRLLGACSTRSDAAARVVGGCLEILKEGQAPLPEEELEAVRRRVLNAGVFEVDSPEEMLRRALDVEFHDYPSDFWAKRADRLRSTSAEEVAAAVARQLDVDRLIVLVVGPADALAEELAAYGEVVRLPAR